MIATTMMDSAVSTGLTTTVFQLLLELSWVAVGFVLYFLLQVAFLPWAQVYYLKTLGVVTPATRTPKTCEDDDEESGSEEANESDKDSLESDSGIARPVVDALEAARQLSAATVKTVEKTSPELAKKTPEGPATTAAISTAQFQGPPGQGRSGGRTGLRRGGAEAGFFAGRREERLAYVRGYQPRQSQQQQQQQQEQQQQQQQVKPPASPSPASSFSRREERLAYVRGYKPNQSQQQQQQQQQQVTPPASPSSPHTPKKRSPRFELSTKKLQRINNSSNGILQQHEQQQQLLRSPQSPKNPSVEDHFLLNLWKEAMAPPQSPSHSSREGSDVE